LDYYIDMCMCSLIFYLVAAQIGANIAWSYRNAIKKSFDSLKRQILVFAHKQLN